MVGLLVSPAHTSPLAAGAGLPPTAVWSRTEQRAVGRMLGTLAACRLLSPCRKLQASLGPRRCSPVAPPRALGLWSLSPAAVQEGGPVCKLAPPPGSPGLDPTRVSPSPRTLLRHQTVRGRTPASFLCLSFPMCKPGIVWLCLAGRPGHRGACGQTGGCLERGVSRCPGPAGTAAERGAALGLWRRLGGRAASLHGDLLGSAAAACLLPPPHGRAGAPRFPGVQTPCRLWPWALKPQKPGSFSSEWPLPPGGVGTLAVSGLRFFFS